MSSQNVSHNDDRSERYWSHFCRSASSALLILSVAACSSDAESLFSPLTDTTTNASPTSQNTQADLNQPSEQTIETPAAAQPGQTQTPDSPNQENSDPAIDIPEQTDPASPASVPASLNVSCDSPSMQSAMLTLTNNARAAARNCGSTGFPATSALSWDDRLEDAARNHTIDMVNNNFFSHTGSNGLSVSDRVSAQGFNWLAVGENIAAGQRSTVSAMNDWLDSAGHCRNIMDGGYTRMAIACQVDPQSDFGVYWTAVYAR